MISLPIGIVLTTLVLLLSMGFDSLGLYFNFHSLLIVVGGTFSIFLFATPIPILKSLLVEVKALIKPINHLDLTKEDLIHLSQDRNYSPKFKEELTDYAQNLWAQGVAQDLFVVLLSQKKKEIEQRAIDSIQSLKNLAKYPPSLGMAGTVMGVIILFKSLSENRDGVGPGLAMAMTATFFGLILANGLIMPLADRLQVKHLNDVRYIQNIYQILLLINQEEASEIIIDEVESRAS